RLRQLPDGVGLEEELDAIVAEGERGDDRRFVQLNAIRYYIRSVLGACQSQWSALTQGVTNYAALLDEIWNWRATSNEPVRIVTFNYDTLVDRALELAIPGLAFSTMESYVNRDDLRLYRPHGCIGWSHVTMNRLTELPNRSEHDVIGLGKNLKSTNEYVPNAGLTLDDRRVLIPAIAIPLRKKLDFEFPKVHQDSLAADIAAATRLLVVGWRAGDDATLTLLSKLSGTNFAMQVVSGSQPGCEETTRNLRAAGLAPRVQLYPGGFTSFVHRREVRGLLYSSF